MITFGNFVLALIIIFVLSIVLDNVSYKIAKKRLRKELKEGPRKDKKDVNR